jgi:hypothetical protein
MQLKQLVRHLLWIEDYTKHWCSCNNKPYYITTGIDLGNESSISDIVMYPNPATAILNVRQIVEQEHTDLLISLVSKLMQVNYLKTE